MHPEQNRTLAIETCIDGTSAGRGFLRDVVDRNYFVVALAQQPFERIEDSDHRLPTAPLSGLAYPFTHLPSFIHASQL